jgi:hypothetical protein
VTDKKSLGQLACPKEWKKYEERNEYQNKCNVDMCDFVYMK